MDDVVSVGQIKHLYFGAESRVGAHGGRAVRGIQMILSPDAKIHKKMVHGAELTDKLRQEILIPVRNRGMMLE
jgi:hypothetical protein